MGKRKSSKKPTPKKKMSPVPTTFDCPFCNHEKTVECKMDKEKWIGYIRCSVCDASYQMMTNYLSEPVDVYSEWLDKCEEENEGVGESICYHLFGSYFCRFYRYTMESVNLQQETSSIFLLFLAFA